METVFQILIVLLLARGLGEVCLRLGQSPTVGELLAGVALAVAAVQLGDAVPFLGAFLDSPALWNLGHVGIFFLVLMAGVEMEPREIAESSRGAFMVAAGGMLVPLLAGCALGWLVVPEGPLRLSQVLVVGVAMSITAVAATVRILEEFDLVHDSLGETVLAAAIFDDVLGLILLAVLSAVAQTGQAPDLGTIAWLLVKVAVFFAVTIALGVHVYPRVSRKLREMRVATIELSALVAAALAYGLLAEALGMHWVLGPFMAGLYFESARVGRTAYEDIKLIVVAVTTGVLGPFFFVSIGLQVEFGAVFAVPGFLLALVVVAFAGKAAGAGLAARLAGLPGKEALAVGIGMTSRGAVALVVLRVAYDAGVFAVADPDAPGIAAHLFSALVLMALVNTLAMPLALRAVLPRPAGEA